MAVMFSAFRTTKHCRIIIFALLTEPYNDIQWSQPQGSKSQNSQKIKISVEKILSEKASPRRQTLRLHTMFLK